MASKRGLYRPAPQENVGQKRNRKPLAQGRLVTNSGAATTKGGKLVSGVNINDETLESTRTSNLHSSYIGHLPTKHVQETSFDQQAVNKVIQGRDHDKTTPSRLAPRSVDRKDLALTPRQIQPQITEQESPVHDKPVNALDLSDSDLDLSYQYRSPGNRVRIQKTSEVLLIDASRQTKDPNQSEVDIAVGFEKSPVKIVCHKPGVLEASLRHTNQKENGRQIHMDRVTAVSFSEPHTDSPSLKQTFKSPYVIKEKLVSGNLKDPYSENVPILTQIERDMQRQEGRLANYPQPNFNDSQGSEISDIPVRDKPRPDLNIDTDDAQSIVSESDACSLHEYVTSSAVKKKRDPPTVKKLPAKTPQTAKKKKTRVVASRYMQAADSKVKTSLSVLLDKSQKEKNNPKSSRSLDFVPPASGKSTKKQVSQRHRSAADNRDGPRTPENSQITTGGKTSTPTMDGSFIPQDIDASAIHPEISVLSTGEVSKTQHTPPRESRRHLQPSENQDIMHDPFSQSILSNASAHQDSMYQTTAKKQQKPKITQRQLDLLYARYTQWLFLHSLAKKVREEQEKQAMAQICGLHEEVEKLRQKHFEMNQDLTRLKHLNQVDEQIDLQRQSLGPVIVNLPKLTKEYENLAHALDTTRHQIATKGIHLPDDDDEFQRQLEHSLLESEQLLGELSVMIRTATPSVTSMSNALQSMEKAVDTQCIELKRCNHMLAAIQSLTVQETSLEIQAIQAKEMEVS